METNTVEKPLEAQESQARCECAAQIADILTRLEKLERDAFTVEKLSNLEPSKISEMVSDFLHPSR